MREQTIKASVETTIETPDQCVGDVAVSVGPDEIDALFQPQVVTAAEPSLSSRQPDGLPPSAVRFTLAELSGNPSSQAAALDPVEDVQHDVTLELGRAHMKLEDALQLETDAVVPLDKHAGDLVDICVDGRLVARGEVLVLKDRLCVRVAQLVAADAAGTQT